MKSRSCLRALASQARFGVPGLLMFTAVLVCATSIAVAARQAAPAAAAGAETPPMAETFFKNVRVLKGIPVDEFIDTMGMFAARNREGLHRLPFPANPGR